MLTIPELRAARQAVPFRPIDCPHCAARLNPHFRIVIATRNCPHCGRQVLVEPEGEETAPPFSREHLNAACEAYLRAQHRFALTFLAGAALLLASVVVVALYRDTIRDAVQPVIDPGTFTVVAVLGPSGAVCLTAFVLLARAQRAALKCPQCSAPCSMTAHRRIPNLTQLTGNCANCGTRLVGEPPAEEPHEPLPTVEEFTLAARRATRTDWVGLLLITAIVLPPYVSVVSSNPARFWRAFEDRYGLVDGTIYALLVFCGGVLSLGAVTILALRWVVWRHQRLWASMPVLNCPHCREKLSATGPVVASQRCPSCRTRVLADPNAERVAGEAAGG